MNIGLKIKEYREKQGLTLKQLSEKSSLSVSFISDIENNRRNPNLNNLGKISNALCVPMSSLIEADQNKNTITPDLEFLNLYQSLSDKQKKEAISFMRYLRARNNR